MFFSYLWNILYALDVFVNVVLGGDRRDTISSRLGKGKKAGKPVHSVLSHGVDFLFKVVFSEDDHCVNNIQIIDDRYAVSSIIHRLREG